jgi:hypothetical protein
MSYIVILMSFTAIFPSIGYGLIKHIYKHGKHTAATKFNEIETKFIYTGQLYLL